MRRLPPACPAAAFAAGVLLAACARMPVPPPAPAAAVPGLCRIGPDGGPPAALAEGERGIGGTGVLADAAEGERGIGGTGIVGVVTGFASLCVNGLHVAYDPAQPVAFADGVATPTSLRVGQVVVVEAGGPEGALRARRIAVRHELAGPVEAVEEGAIRVAGERVALAGALPAGRTWRVGEEVLVSGLRAPDGILSATRIDPRPAGRATLIFGRLTRLGGPARIGALLLRPVPGLALPPDGPVMARGRLEDGVLVPDSVEPDRLMRDPPAYFGTSRVLFEAQIGFGGGRLLLGPGLSVPAGPGIGPGLAGRQVMELRGGPGGALSAGGFGAGRGAGGTPQGPAQASGAGGPARGEPAPMPDRGFEARRGMERSTGGRWSGGAGRPGGAGRGGADGTPGRAGAARGLEGFGPDARLDGGAAGPGPGRGR